MKRLLFLLFICLAQTTQAQQDYVITTKNDTIYGTIKGKPFYFLNKNVKIKTEKGTARIYATGLKEYRRKGQKYMILKKKRPSGKISNINTIVRYDGSIRLLEEEQVDINEHYVYFQGEFIPLHSHTFSDAVWQHLTQCTVFLTEYQEYAEKVKNKRIMNVGKQPKKWKEMLAYYDKQCK